MFSNDSVRLRVLEEAGTRLGEEEEAGTRLEEEEDWDRQREAGAEFVLLTNSCEGGGGVPPRLVEKIFDHFSPVT